MYIAWLTATANVCPVTLNQYGGGGKGTHQHFLYMYMLQRPGHIYMQINEQLIFHIYIWVTS